MTNPNPFSALTASDLVELANTTAALLERATDLASRDEVDDDLAAEVDEVVKGSGQEILARLQAGGGAETEGDASDVARAAARLRRALAGAESYYWEG